MSTGQPEQLTLALTGFLEAAHQIEPHRLPALIAAAAARLGADRTRVWLSDHQQLELVDLDPSASDAPISIDGTMAGRAFITGEAVDVERDGGGHLFWTPLVDGVDRIGVLEIESVSLSPEDRESFRHLASIAAAEIITRGQYTDLYTCTRRSRPMSLAAEIQWSSLPPESFTTAGVRVAAKLEPAYDIGGDSFDYAHAEGRLHFAIFDAVGHDLASTVVSSLALGAYRNSRRSGRDLAESADFIDLAINQQLGQGRFATGQLAILDTFSGRLRWLNAGHPLPLLIRDGHVVGPLQCAPRPPFGLGHLHAGDAPAIVEEQLEPGDAVLLYSDGVVESRRAGAEDFGLERLHEFLHTAFAADYSSSETLRRLSKSVLDFHGGDPRDDATTVLVVWQPDRDREP